MIDEAVFMARVCRMNEDFCLQARRFFAAILTDRKRKQRSLRAKRPFRRCAMAVKTASNKYKKTERQEKSYGRKNSEPAAG
ncbi:hypothetical protein ACSNNR_05725 [Faecalibacterium prausnitzii]|uniref:hypothetical protein n=1 Tax=Faecalibacterium prausnitzii TaxID=853 RepID=UPI003F1D897C